MHTSKPHPGVADLPACLAGAGCLLAVVRSAEELGALPNA